MPGVEAIQPFDASLAKSLEASSFERMVLLPCTDGWAMAVSNLPTSLQTRFPSSVARTEILRQLVDKDLFAATLDRLDLPRPRTHILQEESIPSVPDEWINNYFLKPTHSRPFAEKYRVKAKRLRDREELVRIASETRGMRFGLMLQEYIPGPPTNHYFVEGFRDRQGRFSAMLARQRVRMFPLEFGNSTATRSVPPSQAQPATETLRKLLEAIGYRGVFSAEFKRDERDGLFKILEVNARPWWFVEFAERCGVDVCEMSYRNALGESVEPVARYRISRKCVYPRRDLQCRRARAGTPNRLSIVSMLAFWLGAYQLTLCWDDPIPGAKELYDSARSSLRQLLRA
jgi:predicted ATP-grasp superfamily ATP-dependent carboligase